MRVGIEPTQRVATLLLGGILSDSGRLMRARPETFEALAWLSRRLGMPYSSVVNALSRPMDWPERVARVKGILRMSAYRFGDDGVLCVSSVDAYEASVADALIKVGCDVVLVSSRHGDELRLVGRHNQRFNLSLAKLMRKLGLALGGEGGGHDSAAVLVLSNNEPRLVLSKLIGLIEEELSVKMRVL
jgi:nanoRNase/pAp phosphatase (c-di-AMP/oligoRNAs hydrolase)